MTQPIKTVSEWGTEVWTLHGEKHREDGPAIVLPDGRESWYLHGKLHRVDGPAYRGYGNRVEWWLNNVRVTEEEHKKILSCPREELPLLIGTSLEPIAQWRLSSKRKDTPPCKSNTMEKSSIEE